MTAIAGRSGGFLRLLCALGLLCAVALNAQAAELIAREQLRDLDLAFAPVEVADERPGRPQLMRVDTLPDDTLQLRLPFRPNRLERLVPDGGSVTAGQALARISGPELVAWLLEARAIEARFADAAARYRANRPLYQQQALSADLWQRIADRYYALQLEQHHVEHVLEWLQPTQDPEPEALLVAPRGGRVLFSPLPEVADGEIPLLRLLDTGSLRLVARLPGAQAETVLALRSGACDLPIDGREGRVTGLSRRVWSQPLAGCLEATPGLPVDGYPVYALDGYRVPRPAIIRHGGRTLLALDRDGDLALQEVSLDGEDDMHFYLRSTVPLAGRRVLVRSVSAVQGILLGLGGE